MPGVSKKGGGLEVGSAYKMKNSALHMGAKYGTPIQKNYGKGMPLTEGGKKAIMASDANPEFKAAIANSPVDMHSPAKNYKNPQDYKVFMMGNEATPVKKYKNAAQRKAVHASKAERSPNKKKEYSKEAKNLLKAVPDKNAYDKLDKTSKAGFDKAAKKYGLPTKRA